MTVIGVAFVMAENDMERWLNFRRGMYSNMLCASDRPEVFQKIWMPCQQVMEGISNAITIVGLSTHAKNGPYPSSKVMNKVVLHVGRTYSFHMFATFFRENIYGSKFVSAFRQYSHHQIWERYNRPNLDVSGFGELTVRVERKLKRTHSQLKGISLVKNGELPDTVLAVLQETV